MPVASPRIVQLRRYGVPAALVFAAMKFSPYDTGGFYDEMFCPDSRLASAPGY